MINTTYYILEVYEDKFKLITPNFFSKVFSKADVYYFDEFSKFEYIKEDSIEDERPPSTKGEVALAVALSLMFRSSTYGARRSLFGTRNSSYNPASIKFDHTVNVTEEVTYAFPRADNDFKKGLEVLSDQMNKTALSKNNPMRNS